MTRLALIGYGAIGRYVAAQVKDWPEVTLSAVVVRAARVADLQRQMGADAVVTANIDDLPDDLDLVIECAGHSGLSEHGAAVLSRGHRLLVVSVGALADPVLLAQLRAAAAAGGGHLQIAAGAIGGIDAIAAAREGGLAQVHYTSRKPPNAWRGTAAETRCDLSALTAETILLEGPADVAAQAYPQNANVAATLAMAAGGFDKVAVRLIADPAADGNIHQIDANGAFGSLSLEMRGKPLPENPKTSSLTAYSILRAIRNTSDVLDI